MNGETLKLSGKDLYKIKINKLKDYIDFIEKGLEYGIKPNILMINEMQDVLERMKGDVKNG